MEPCSRTASEGEDDSFENALSSSAASDATSIFIAKSADSLLEDGSFYALPNNAPNDNDNGNGNDNTELSITIAHAALFAKTATSKNKAIHNKVVRLLRTFLQEAADESLWQWTSPLVNNDLLTVVPSSRPSAPCCLRLEAANVRGDAQNAWEVFANVSNRATWDAMCESSRVIEWINPLTCIYHIKLKATWPTAARDACLLAAFRKLEMPNGQEAFVTVAESIEDERCPSDPTGKTVRMHTRLVGNLFTPSSRKGKKVSTFSWLQVGDADPRGFIPGSLVRHVATKSLPQTLQRVQEVLDQCNKPRGIYAKAINELTQEASAQEANTQDDSSPADKKLSPIACDSDLLRQLQDIRTRFDALELKMNACVPGLKERLLAWAPVFLSSAILVLLLRKRNK
jgi:hypothetical protein